MTSPTPAEVREAMDAEKAWEQFWERHKLPDEAFIAPGYAVADKIAEFAQGFAADLLLYIRELEQVIALPPMTHEYPEFGHLSRQFISDALDFAHNCGFGREGHSAHEIMSVFWNSKKAKPAPLPGEVRRYICAVKVIDGANYPHALWHANGNMVYHSDHEAAIRALTEKNAELAAEVERLKKEAEK